MNTKLRRMGVRRLLVCLSFEFVEINSLGRWFYFFLYLVDVDVIANLRDKIIQITFVGFENLQQMTLVFGEKDYQNVHQHFVIKANLVSPLNEVINAEWEIYQ